MLLVHVEHDCKLSILASGEMAHKNLADVTTSKV